MCFTDDCDWYASIVEDEILTASKPTQCNECHEMIQEGGWLRHIFMQEHEECIHDPTSENYDFEGEHEGEGCPEGCEHDYGETCDYDRCETCDQLIEAIHQHELVEGCSHNESYPNLDGLYDAFWEGNGKAYLARAETLYPGITERLTESFRYAIFRKDED